MYVEKNPENWDDLLYLKSGLGIKRKSRGIKQQLETELTLIISCWEQRSTCKYDIIIKSRCGFT